MPYRLHRWLSTLTRTLRLPPLTEISGARPYCVGTGVPLDCAGPGSDADGAALSRPIRTSTRGDVIRSMVIVTAGTRQVMPPSQSTPRCPLWMAPNQEWTTTIGTAG